ncbi:MAG: ATP-binding protein [Dysgonamonadaceae bacterium]|jgi:predicted AAA+ superfamily ATPase|nr:ATP-binding protein [Dysgonamonadaceae bacterium]
MNKEIIKNIIREKQQEIAEIQIIERNYQLESSSNYVFVGLRRAGKSFLMYQQIHQFIARGSHSIEDMLFVNFEDERINGISAGLLGLVIDAYKELYNKKPIVFLDEIQNIAGWEKFARRLADSKYQVFISGSNAQMLSKEIYTTLGGRFMVKEVFPFSFEEYLRFHQIVLEKNWQYGEERNTVVNLFEKYFYFGGFAESFAFADKRDYINSLYHKILLGDIIARNEIRNDKALRILMKKIAETVVHPVSLSKLKNAVNSTGLSIAKNTLIDYLGYAKDAYLLFDISNFSDKFSEKETVKKRYFFDNGLLNLFLLDPNSRLLENLVAIELYKKYADRLFYYNRNIEVDFFVPDEKTAIQASYSINDEMTRNREVGALLKLAEVYPDTRLIIVTFNEDEIITEQEHHIEVVPIWKWLLSNNM